MPVDFTTGLYPHAANTVHLVHGFPVERSTDKGFEATVQLRCPWTHRFDLLTDILQNRLLYPYRTTSNARAKTGGSTPAAGKSSLLDTQALSYDEAIVTIEYATNDEEDDGVDVYSESLEPSAEFLTLDPAKFRWGSASGTQVEPAEAPGMLIVGFDLLQTNYKLSALPTTIITELGHCNQASITATILGLTFTAEQLLFVTATPSRTVNSDGDFEWTLPKRFSFRKNGWNKFWRASTGTFESIFIAGGSQYRSYPTSTLLPLT